MVGGTSLKRRRRAFAASRLVAVRAAGSGRKGSGGLLVTFSGAWLGGLTTDNVGGYGERFRVGTFGYDETRPTEL